MPIHDWSMVAPGYFHHFHTSWITHLSDNLNELLPAPFFAMSEQHFAGNVGDVVALSMTVKEDEDPYETDDAGGVAILDAPPKVSRHLVLDRSSDYSERARRIVIRNRSGHDIVAIVEIVSPGNKDHRARIRTFVDKSVQSVRNGIHLLLIDLLPPGTFDPCGVHNEIWHALGGGVSPAPDELPLTVSSFLALVESPEAYVEPTAVGNLLIPMPLFLDGRRYIEVPLEDSYMRAWQGVPAVLKSQIAHPTV